MTSKELLYVKTIAELGNMSKAAKKLFIAQPSLSQAVQRLEESLGAPLFNRTPGGLTLTHIGEKYYQIATQILKIYRDFEVFVSDENNLKTGRIHFGVTTHLGSIVLPKILPVFHRKCPSVEVRITEANSTVLEEKLIAGELDFIVIHSAPVCERVGFHYERMRRDPFLIVTGQDHPLQHKANILPNYPFPVLDLKHIREEPFLLLTKPQRIRQISDGILKNAGIIQPKIALTLGNYRTAQLLATEGYGITFVPMSYSQGVAYDKEPLFFSIPEQYEPYWSLSVATIPETYLSKADLYFIHLMRGVYTPPRTPKPTKQQPGIKTPVLQIIYPMPVPGPICFDYKKSCPFLSEDAAFLFRVSR